MVNALCDFFCGSIVLKSMNSLINEMKWEPGDLKRVRTRKKNNTNIREMVKRNCGTWKHKASFINGKNAFNSIDGMKQQLSRTIVRTMNKWKSDAALVNKNNNNTIIIQLFGVRHFYGGGKAFGNFLLSSVAIISNWSSSLCFTALHHELFLRLKYYNRPVMALLKKRPSVSRGLQIWSHQKTEEKKTDWKQSVIWILLEIRWHKETE